MFEPIPTTWSLPPARPALRLVPSPDGATARAGMVETQVRLRRREGAVVATSTLESALPNLLVESLLPTAGRLVMGDAAATDRLDLASPEPGRRPFVWVTGTAGGPVRAVWLVFRADDLDRRPVLVGHLDCPSGRIVAGDHDSVAAWGDDLEPDAGLAAQARAYDHERRLRGLAVVARVAPGRYPVFAVEGVDGYDAVMVDVSAGEPLPLAG